MSTGIASREVDRGTFLKASFVGGAFILGIDFGALPRAAHAAASPTQLNAYIRIGTDESITIVAPNSELGQGTSTALPMIVAEELKADWSKVRMELAGANAAFANPMFHLQLTGGSTAVRGYYQALRTVGASAREMLIAAGAAKFGVNASDCVAEKGAVRVATAGLPSSGQVATYGSLAAAAASLAPPANPPLTDRKNFQIVGTSIPRLDIPAKVNGSAVFGIDVRLPGMVYAAVKQSPKVGQIPGAIGAAPRGMKTVALPNGVAVVATTTTWAAIKAANSLSVTWIDAPSTASADTTAMKAAAAALMTGGSPVRVALNTGDAPGAIAKAAKTVTATYSVPYVPHTSLEPMNATALVTPTSCEIWAPTQAQGPCVLVAAAITGLTPDKITLHTTYLGGGMGRKGETDFVEQAVRIAKTMPGTPVKLTWSREEDMTQDFYRPASLCSLTGSLDSTGALTGISSRTVSPSIGYQKGPARYADPTAVDSSAVEGITTMPYALPSQRTEWILDTAPVRVSYWRSVGNSYNVFFAESFIDELAAAAGKDPIAFRRGMLGANPRALAVLDTLTAKSGWAAAPKAGHARGVAISQCFGSIVGEVVDISGSLTTGIKVNSVTVVIDCGNSINPDTVRAQMESAVLQGLGVALWGDMPFTAGKPMRRNFNTYKMPRMRDAPAIDTTIIESGGPLGGVGEPGLPPIAPALGNAIARLTGTRLRSLPMFPQPVPTS
ncbi:MAG: molybdopterin cofactor-binding domain-containing protein [Actinomycetes bacterium]